MAIENPMKLRVKETLGGGYEIWLDEKRIHHVEGYKIESSTSGRTAELSIKMLVQYPVSQENVSRPLLLQLPKE